MGVEGEYYDGPCKLLELPQDVLRILFSYVDATALFHLSQVCNYLKDFIEDPAFWRYVDARDDPNIPEKLEYCTNKVHDKSTHLLLQGNLNLYDLPINFFDKIKPYENLRVLALENFKLQGSRVTLKDFPSGLEELSLRRTYLKNSTYFFQHSVRNMPKLKVLVLDECCWVTCSFLLSVSKYEHLEIISIVKCIRVHMNMIPYLNVSKFGCKKLKVVDCRFTGIGGDLIRTFFSSSSIQRLYFQSFKSGEVDYNEKIINSDGDPKKRSPADASTDISISDNHLADYASTSSKPKNEIEPVFDSVLYQDPYPECTCGADGSKEEFGVDEILYCDDDNLNIPYGRGETKFVCNKHMKDIVDLPSSFRNFFLTQQRRFNPVSEADEDSDSNSEDEEGGCCYFGMGTKMVLPSTHDRTPSRTEEMSLPGEGARNQSPRVLILNPLGELERENGAINDERPNNSSNNTNRERNTTKKRHVSSDDSDSDADGLERKRMKIVSTLLNTAENVSNRIEKIRVKNGMPPTQRRSSVNSRDSSIEEDRHSMPSCSTNGSNKRQRLEEESPPQGAGARPSCSSHPPRSGKPEGEKREKGEERPPCTVRTEDRQVNFEVSMSGDEECSTSSDSNSSLSSGEEPKKRAESVRGAGLRRLSGDEECSTPRGYSSSSLSSGAEAERRRAETGRGAESVRGAEPGRGVVLGRGAGDRAGVHEPAAWRVIFNEQDRRRLKFKIPLRRLSLRGYRKITDVTLIYLKNIDLELIDLTYTSVSKQGIEDFLVHNPNCRVIHPLYCTCKPKNSLF